MPLGIALWFALLAPQSSLPPPTTPAPPAATDSAKPAAPATPPPEPPVRNLKTPCAPGRSGTYEGEIGLKPPVVIHEEEPVIPEAARQNKIHGSPVVSVTVDIKGQPTNVHIVRSAAKAVDEKLHAAALSMDQYGLDAVKKYRFEAATCNGRKVPYELHVQVFVDSF